MSEASRRREVNSYNSIKATVYCYGRIVTSTGRVRFQQSGHA